MPVSSDVVNTTGETIHVHVLFGLGTITAGSFTCSCEVVIMMCDGECEVFLAYRAENSLEIDHSVSFFSEAK